MQSLQQQHAVPWKPFLGHLKTQMRQLQEAAEKLKAKAWQDCGYDGECLRSLLWTTAEIANPDSIVYYVPGKRKLRKPNKQPLTFSTNYEIMYAFKP
mmetsp:Transcript_21584/g.33603  ORF Transcript_21584/g.33603 Transcript_21584/m.33603 type:complete len:97 (-) Transcript_21584:33-323(-)